MGYHLEPTSKRFYLSKIYYYTYIIENHSDPDDYYQVEFTKFTILKS